MADDIREELRSGFDGLFHRLGVSPSPRALFDELFAMYTRSARHYHNAGHLRHCLRELAAGPSPDNLAVATALWFHDAIYDAQRQDNETRSAELAVARLGPFNFEPPFLKQVDALVRITDHRATPSAPDEQLITDIDLAILGQPRSVFEAYERAIRNEYAHVPDADFIKGRAGVLRHFLERSPIYQTAHFRDKYEAAARTNLKASLEALHSPE